MSGILPTTSSITSGEKASIRWIILDISARSTFFAISGCSGAAAQTEAASACPGVDQRPPKPKAIA